MKKIGITTLLTIATYLTLSAQAFPTDLSKIESPEIKYANEIIDNLCDSKMYGRGVAKSGEQLAADYILTEFRAMGIMPIGDNYFQDFKVDANTFPGNMSLTMGKDKESLKPGIDFWVDPTCSSVNGEYKIVYISREQMKDRLVLMDKLRDAEGGFILVDNTVKTNETPELTKKLNTYIDKMKTDLKVQIYGVIVYDKMNLRRNSASIQSPRPTIYISKEIENISEIKSAKFGIDADYKTGYETQNVAAIVEGKVFKDSVIIITAHYDHLGTMGENVSFPGANSNAAGVAMLLNLARHFYKIRPKYSIIFLALGGEELDFAGSNAYVNSPAFPLSKTRFVINLDVIGMGENGTKVVNGTKFQDIYNKLEYINKKDNYINDLTARGQVCFSGHCAFDKKEIPSFWIYTIGGNYHNLDDTPENTPLTNFDNMYNLVIKFIEKIK